MKLTDPSVKTVLTKHSLCLKTSVYRLKKRDLPTDQSDNNEDTEIFNSSDEKNEKNDEKDEKDEQNDEKYEKYEKYMEETQETSLKSANLKEKSQIQEEKQPLKQEMAIENQEKIFKMSYLMQINLKNG